MTKRLLCVALSAFMAGCTAVPYTTAQQACHLLEIAMSEAEMAPAWYLQTGKLLETCGVRNATAWGEEASCYAERRSGIDKVCGEPTK